MDIQDSCIKDFGDFNIKVKRNFLGPKIYGEELFDQAIIVHGYEIKPSTKKGKEGTEFLYVQIIFNDEERVLWSSSKFLMATLREVPGTGFPFRTKIVKNYKGYEFRSLNK